MNGKKERKKKRLSETLKFECVFLPVLFNQRLYLRYNFFCGGGFADLICLANFVSSTEIKKKKKKSFLS